MAKITKISPEQVAMFADWTKKWIDIGLSTEPADFDAATEAALKAYKLANLNRPMVVLRMGSPYAATVGGVIAWSMLRNLTSAQVRAQVRDQVGAQVGDQVRAQVRAQVGAQVWAQVRDQVGDQVRAQVRDQVWDQVRDQVGDQVWDQVGDQVWDQVGAQVWAQVRDQVRDQVGAQVWAQVWDSVYNNYGGSLWSSAWDAYISFFRDVMGWEDTILERASINETLTKSCGWVWWHENVCAISDRPSEINRDPRGRLHNEFGPSIAYRDGWSLYHIHGVVVPEWVIRRPEEIDVAKIDAEQNAEVRRVMIDRFGADRYVIDSGSKVVAQCGEDHSMMGLRTAKLYRKELNGDEPIIMLDMLNSTPEPDGTTKRYMIRIDPNAYGGEASTDCLAAMASTYRMPDGSLLFARPSDYSPMIET